MRAFASRLRAAALSVAAALVGVCLLLVCACSSNDAATTQEDNTTTTLTVVSTLKNEPFQTLGATEPEGFAVEVLEHAADSLGMTISYERKVKDTSVISAIEDGEADVALSYDSTSELIPDTLVQAGSCVELGAAVVVKKKSGIEDVSDLKSKSVALSPVGNLSSWLSENVSDCKATECDDSYDALSELQAENYDAAVVDIPSARRGCKVSYGDCQVIYTEATGTSMCLYVNAENTELAEKLQAAVSEFTESDEYDELHEEWFGDAPERGVTPNVIVPPQGADTHNKA